MPEGKKEEDCMKYISGFPGKWARFALILLLCALLLFGAACALAEEETPVEYAELKSRFNVSFYRSDYHCTIGAKGTVTGAVVIPSRVIVRKGDGLSMPTGVESEVYTVTEVVSFQSQKGITSVTFPEGLLKINNSAFLNCTGLSGDLVIPNSVTYLGRQAFRGCTGLNGTLTIGRGLSTIQDTAFYECGFTGRLNIPDTVTTIEASAFMKCKGFTGDLIIPSSVTTIGNHAFRECTGFNGNLILPASVISMGESVFQGCTHFTGLTISPGFTAIPAYTFYLCSGMTGSLVIPDSVTSIGVCAFEDCSGFTGTLYIHSGLTEISNTVFSGCSGFTGLSIAPGVTAIGSRAFQNCAGMTGDLVLPDTITTVQQNAFENCGFTGDLTLPESLTYLNESAFALPNITGTLTIPSSITNSLSQQGFNGMFRVKRIVNHSDAGIYLKYNFIPEEDDETYFTESGSEEHLQKMTWNGYAVTIHQGVFLRNGGSFGAADFILPTHITVIQEGAFEGISARSVEISPTCTQIGARAFRNCPNLEKIRIPEGCAIGEDAFAGCGTVMIYGVLNSPAELYCQTHDNCMFMVE